MKFHPFGVSIPHITYAALGGFVVLFGMFSLFIREKLYIGESCLAFLFGVVIGPYGGNIFNPRDWGGGDREVINNITLEFTRVVLAIGVFAIGVELPKAYMARHWKSLFFLIVPVMTWGWFVSASLIYGLIPGLNFLSSLAVAACLTPTDPILAAAVVGGKYADKHVPAHLRHLLAAESGCNDGAAYPFLFIALYLTIEPTTGRAISDWFLALWLYQVILGVVFGGCLGFGFRHLMKFCERMDLIDRQSYVAQYVSLSLLTIGSCTLLGTDDLLAAFSCGTAFAWDGFFNKQTEESVFSSVIDLLFNVAAFVFLGAWMPFNSFDNKDLSLSVWRLIVIAILVLLLRRLPAMIALYKWIPDVKTFREAVFSGHFGPMGVGAVFISTLAVGQLAAPASPPANQEQLLAATIQPIVAFMVLCSILIHGLSIPFFSLGRRVHTVSRTWSRHDTFGRAAVEPEWAQQTRRVVLGEDIVINRDSQMERGELTMEEKIPTSRRDSETQVEQESPVSEKMAGSSTQTQDEEAMREIGVDMREEQPPDGTERVLEWREGPHKIVERRTGPGQEVEVQVHRNYYSPEDTYVHSFRVAEEHVHDVINDIRHKLHSAAESAQHEMHRMTEQAGHAAHQLGSEVGQALDPPTAPERGDEEEEEEGWMSDRSNGEPSGVTPSADYGKKRSRSTKHKPPQHPGSMGRRRSSGRRSRPPRPQHEEPAAQVPEAPSPPATLPGTAQPEQVERRGRRFSSFDSPTSPARRSARHSRIDSIRTMDVPSRELSPARSVRWADEADVSEINVSRLPPLPPSPPGSPPAGTSPTGTPRTGPSPGGSEAPSGDET